MTKLVSISDEFEKTVTEMVNLDRQNKLVWLTKVEKHEKEESKFRFAVSMFLMQLMKHPYFCKVAQAAQSEIMLAYSAAYEAFLAWKRGDSPGPVRELTIEEEKYYETTGNIHALPLRELFPTVYGDKDRPQPLYPGGCLQKNWLYFIAEEQQKAKRAELEEECMKRTGKTLEEYEKDCVRDEKKELLEAQLHMKILAEEKKRKKKD
jgi:hypothetical protein